MTRLVRIGGAGIYPLALQDLANSKRFRTVTAQRSIAASQLVDLCHRDLGTKYREEAYLERELDFPPISRSLPGHVREHKCWLHLLRLRRAFSSLMDCMRC